PPARRLSPAAGILRFCSWRGRTLAFAAHISRSDINALTRMTGIITLPIEAAPPWPARGEASEGSAAAQPRQETRRIPQTVAACAALGLVGIFAAAPASAATICWAFQDLETEFWVAGHKAVIQSLEEGGHTVIERNANESANKQLEQIRDCIAQGVDGII